MVGGESVKGVFKLIRQDKSWRRYVQRQAQVRSDPRARIMARGGERERRSVWTVAWCGALDGGRARAQLGVTPIRARQSRERHHTEGRWSSADGTGGEEVREGKRVEWQCE